MSKEVQPQPEAKKSKSRSYGVNDVLNWKFEDAGIPSDWQKHLGDLPSKFSIYVDGDDGQGKTEYNMRISQMFAMNVGKVHFNNIEQGKHKQITQSAVRNEFKKTVKPGKWIYSIIHEFDSYVEKLLAVNSGKIQIIDSISYWPLTADQIHYLFKHKKFRNKCWLLTAYQAHFTRNKPIAHMCDIKIRIIDHIAYVKKQRFGGGSPLDLWPTKPQHLWTTNIRANTDFLANTAIAPGLFGDDDEDDNLIPAVQGAPRTTAQNQLFTDLGFPDNTTQSEPTA